jgi:hypothetical protein
MTKKCRWSLGKAWLTRLVEEEKDAEEAGTMESIKTKILILVD